MFKNLKGTIFNFIKLSHSPEEIDQNSRVAEIQNIVKNCFKTLSKTSKFVLRKCPNLKKVHPRELTKISVLQFTRKGCA